MQYQAQKQSPYAESPRRSPRYPENWDQRIHMSSIYDESGRRSPPQNRPQNIPGGGHHSDSPRRSPNRVHPFHVHASVNESSNDQGYSDYRKASYELSTRKSASREHPMHQMQHQSPFEVQDPVSYKSEPPTPKPRTQPMQQPTQATDGNNEDSDDSTATRILEKSEILVSMGSPSKKVGSYPKSNVIYGEDSITVTRPKTAEHEARRDLKLCLEIEPFDQITIKTPPKTPEKRAIEITKVDKSITPPKQYMTQEKYMAPSIKSEELIRSEITPVAPIAQLQLDNVPFPRPKTPPKELSPEVNVTPTIMKAKKTLPPIEVSEKTKAVLELDAEPISSSAGSAYESNTDNEHIRKPIRGKKVKRSPIQQPIKKKLDDSKYADKSEKPRDLIVNCFVQLQSNNWEEIIEVS